MQESDPVDEKLLSQYHRRGAASERHCSPLAMVRGHRIAARGALVSRTDIDQAIGALRVLNGGSAEDAFGVLVERSQSEDIKVRDLALRIVEDLSRSMPRDRAVRNTPVADRLAANEWAQLRVHCSV
jgi:hypothetical protein